MGSNDAVAPLLRQPGDYTTLRRNRTRNTGDLIYVRRQSPFEWSSDVNILSSDSFGGSCVPAGFPSLSNVKGKGVENLIVQAFYGYDPLGPHEVKVTPGDMIYLLEQRSSGWSFCINLSTPNGLRGWMPSWRVSRLNVEQKLARNTLTGADLRSWKDLEQPQLFRNCHSTLPILRSWEEDLEGLLQSWQARRLSWTHVMQQHQQNQQHHHQYHCLLEQRHELFEDFHHILHLMAAFPIEQLEGLLQSWKSRRQHLKYHADFSALPTFCSSYLQHWNQPQQRQKDRYAEHKQQLQQPQKQRRQTKLKQLRQQQHRPKLQPRGR